MFSPNLPQYWQRFEVVLGMSCSLRRLPFRKTSIPRPKKLTGKRYRKVFPVDDRWVTLTLLCLVHPMQPSYTYTNLQIGSTPEPPSVLVCIEDPRGSSRVLEDRLDALFKTCSKIVQQKRSLNATKCTNNEILEGLGCLGFVVRDRGVLHRGRGASMQTNQETPAVQKRRTRNEVLIDFFESRRQI